MSGATLGFAPVLRSEAPLGGSRVVHRLTRARGTIMRLMSFAGGTCAIVLYDNGALRAEGFRDLAESLSSPVPTIPQLPSLGA